MKTFKILSLFFICLALGTGSVWAQQDKSQYKPKAIIAPTLYLQAIKANVQTEAGGDEVYLAITEFRHGGKNRHYTIPQSPLYWPDGALPEISHLEIWKGALGIGESTEVMVGFVERDAPPWNTDDMMGAIKIKMMNKEGHLQTQWILMDKKTKEQKMDVKQEDIHSYQLTGEDGDYKVDLLLKKQ